MAVVAVRSVAQPVLVERARNAAHETRGTEHPAGTDALYLHSVYVDCIDIIDTGYVSIISCIKLLNCALSFAVSAFHPPSAWSRTTATHVQLCACSGCYSYRGIARP